MAESYADALRYKAAAAFKASEYDQAIEMFDELVGITDNPLDQLWRGQALQLAGRYAEACEIYELVLRDNPSDLFALHHLAHIKASCENQSLRDGKLAVNLATHLCKLSDWQEWSDVSVLAAAHAEVGDWKQAELFANMALELAPENEKERRHRTLDQYRERRPFRSSPEMNQSLLVRREGGWEKRATTNELEKT
jgi:tetratricopeptide (TPR) repeat protein